MDDAFPNRLKPHPSNIPYLGIIRTPLGLRDDSDRAVPSMLIVSCMLCDCFRLHFADSITCAGGERNRLHLASVLRQQGNVLLLDEPTNDLDVDTLRALENAILNFAGKWNLGSARDAASILHATMSSLCTEAPCVFQSCIYFIQIKSALFVGTALVISHDRYFLDRIA